MPAFLPWEQRQSVFANVSAQKQALAQQTTLRFSSPANCLCVAAEEDKEKKITDKKIGKMQEKLKKKTQIC